MAAAEALWETEQPAGFALVAGIDQQGESNSFELKIPAVLSFLSYNNFTGKVQGIKELQSEAEQKYGTGYYVPPVTLLFWAFRLMVGSGSLMVLLALMAVLWPRWGHLDKKGIFLKALMLAPLLPFLASTMGWVMAETGRWPWIVYGLQLVEDAVSPNVPAWNVAFSLIVMGLLYGALTVVAVKLALKFGKSDVKVKETAAAD
jgi:cytochrome d ubiquinol oxidase subunit I